MNIHTNLWMVVILHISIQFCSLTPLSSTVSVVLLVELCFVTDLSDVDDDDDDDGGIVCILCRVDRSEDLFHGNKADGMQNPDSSAEYQASFCLCDRPHGSDPEDVNKTAVCGRRAVSDTTADDSEPQRNVRLGVPKVIVEKRRRRKRQTPGRGQNGFTSSQRIYQTDYE